MTEVRWWEETDPHLMLRLLLRVGAGYRRMRLFSVACCRRIEHLCSDQYSAHVVALSEQFADGRISLEELKRAHRDAGWAVNWDRMRARGVAAIAAVRAVEASASQTWLFWETVRSEAARAAPDGVAERKCQCDLLRDIFGNPFRPFSVDESWLRWNDATIRRMAACIYEERAFDRLPILHDALLDAGCDNEDMLAHCRSEGPHVRGCWVVDLLLDKT